MHVEQYEEYAFWCYFALPLACQSGDWENGTVGAVGEETCAVWAVYGAAAF